MHGKLTFNLRLEPAESRAVQLLVGCSIGETVGHRDVREELEHTALHSKFIEVASLVSLVGAQIQEATHVSSSEKMPSGSFSDEASAMMSQCDPVKSRSYDKTEGGVVGQDSL